MCARNPSLTPNKIDKRINETSNVHKQTSTAPQPPIETIAQPNPRNERLTRTYPNIQGFCELFGPENQNQQFGRC